MWANAMQLWPPTVPTSIDGQVESIAYAIGLVQNSCIEATFPADNPVPGTPRLHVANPMNPIDPKSFWSTDCAPAFVSGKAHPAAQKVVDAVSSLYDDWSKELGHRPRLTVSYAKPYFVGQGVLTRNSGLTQIRDFAKENNRAALTAAWAAVQTHLKALYGTLHSMILDVDGLDYFSATPSLARASVPPVAPVLQVAEKK
jgi:hypothetical protein